MIMRKKVKEMKKIKLSITSVTKTTVNDMNVKYLQTNDVYQISKRNGTKRQTVEEYRQMFGFSKNCLHHLSTG